MKRKHKLLAILALAMLVTVFLLAEATCRLQQALGPIWDLKLEEPTCDLYRLSETLNHSHRPEQRFVLWDQERFGEHYGFAYTQYYDEDGIRLNKSRPPHERGGRGLTILFLGDSFMQGYDDENTIPHHVWSYLREALGDTLPLQALNAGASSYSTLIYTAQAKQLVPKIRPDFVVVDIDETDLADDCFRYDRLTVRDEHGKVAAVRGSKMLQETRASLDAVRRHRLYLLRFLTKVYHYRIRLPALARKFRECDDARLVARDMDKDAAKKYAKHLGIFERNVEELAETLTALMGSPRRVFFAFHPHLGHLKPNAQSRTWNRLVAKSIERAAKRHNVPFYSAIDDLCGAFGDRPERYYWGPPDMHFNFKGLRIYSEHLARAIAPLLQEDVALQRGAGSPSPSQ